MMRTRAIGRDVAKEIVSNCVDHLFSLIGSDGKFTYAHKQFDVTDLYGGYNLLRHCGTVWFICSASRSLSLNISLERMMALEAAIGYVREKTKEPSWTDGLLPTLCVTSSDVVKLGAVGLDILMLREFSNLIDSGTMKSADAGLPDWRLLTCARLENYIVAQSTGDDFLHKRNFSTGKILGFHSDYYTGEALFALMHSPIVRPEVRMVMESLLHRDYGIKEQSHWMAYAACAALKVGYCDQTRIAQYLERLVERIIADPSYRSRHESTPIACRSEALMEFLRTTREVEFARQYFSTALVDGARATALENLHLQLKYYGQGQFRKGRDSSKVQIDYIQHNGAAFLGWWHLSDEQT